MKWPGSLAAYRSPHCLFTGANGRVSVCPGQMAIFQFTGFTFIIYFFMSVLLLNEQELCGHNTFMAKNIGRLHQNLHDFRPPTPCPAFGCISRGIQRTELVRAGPGLSKPSSLCFQTQTSRFLCIFFFKVYVHNGCCRCFCVHDHVWTPEASKSACWKGVGNGGSSACIQAGDSWELLKAQRWRLLRNILAHGIFSHSHRMFNRQIWVQ